MGLARHIAPVDRRALLWHWLESCSILAAVMIVPLAVSLAAGEYRLGAIFGAVAAAGFGVGRLRHRFHARTLTTRDALVVTALAYATFAALGAVPMLVALSPLDALFESMSSFTTTGLSVADPAELPATLVFFRAYGQWVGGAGIVILSLALVLGTGRASLELFESEHVERDLAGSVRATARVVIRIYLALTAVGFAVFAIAGLPWREAIMSALATLSTGGFSAHGDSVHGYASSWARMAFVPIMLLGATSFPLLYRARREGWRTFVRDVELRTMLIALAAAALVIWVSGRAAGQTGAASVFHATSALTTAGFSVSDPADWPAATTGVVILLMVVGGSGGSTAGGIKLRRLGLALASARWMITRASLPREAVTPLRYGGEVAGDNEERLLLAFLSFYLFALLGSSLLFALAGYPPGVALFESASALGTVGLSAGATGPDLEPWLKAVLVLDMWAGRLEILPVLLVLSARTWRSTGGSS